MGAGTDPVFRMNVLAIIALIFMINWFYAAHNVLSLLA